ncbi:hypothetical protein [Vibrio methylphosphonaticus]|uniref:hypothetical protein n=1 Tax=Vibrio methylphosphonaticus TaxID=2946866 RepID=UPI00202A8A14|nr:hypothetical protein [Vibrio methylphosphonaticus]MCL9777216.1 hypothetical protein [Vibrio methylphosphonaticus]
MSIKDSIEAIEQQIYVACSDGDYDAVNMLEHQLDHLRELSNQEPEDPQSREPSNIQFQDKSK